MTEAISWPEGAIYLWTGTATASALVGLARDTTLSLLYGIDNYQTFDTAYHDLHTGQRADVGVGSLYTTDRLTLSTFADAKTAVHMHLAHTGVYGSAGWFLYSGALDLVQVAGGDGRTFEYRVQYHANRWSAY
jgi:hypothetical protein